MPNVSMLIKPASGGCNMRCRYCFYEDETQKRETPSFGRMSPQVLEALVRRAFERATTGCSLAFQGGEPTLVGLPFYERLIELVAQYNVRRVPVHYAIQTNGYAIDEGWAAFFAENRFLVGLSLDGPKEIHDRYRLDAKGEGTYKRVMHAAQLFKKHKVDFNLLTVVTAQTARSAAKLYGFYQRSGFHYQQYIPCLDPLGEARGGHEYSLTPEGYAQFLKTMFDCWYQDVRRGVMIYNRYFENLAALLLGRPAESCGLMGRCSMQYVVEADGGVYPCDFYVLDRYHCGNLVSDSLDTIDGNLRRTGFIEESLRVEAACRGCEWFPVCHGGCRRDRDTGAGLSRNWFCEAYKAFFPYALPRLRTVLRP